MIKIPAPLAERDQHFCIDENILTLMVETARVTRRDVVLEIGSGPGNLTAKLAQKAGKVIAIEVDPRFAPILKGINALVEVVIGDGLKMVSERKDFDKIVANLPFQICEPLMHLLCKASLVELSVLMVPERFAEKLLKHPIFPAFLIIEKIKPVPKEAFYPRPSVSSQIILITPRKTLDQDQLIIQKLYQQRDKKLKNGLREALIDSFNTFHKQTTTKREAEKFIQSMELSDTLLETLIARLSLKQYQEILVAVQKLPF